jgi:predicted HTH domain antitoxin
MMTLNVTIPDEISEFHQQNTEIITSQVQVGLIVWEYLNGHLSLSESADILQIPYRSFVDMLWNQGIPIDGLNSEELERQTEQLRKLL